MKQWLRNALIERLVVLIEIEEIEEFKQIYSDCLKRLTRT